MIRCFIAVEIPPSVLDSIQGYMASLKPLSSDIRWVRTSAMHITLKFLGEITETSVERVRDKLLPVGQQSKPFDLAATGSGFFPNRSRPRVVWIGLEQDTDRSLFMLQQWIEDALVTEGFKREKRRFSPHITLGRIKATEHIEPLFEYMERNPFPVHKFSVRSVNLMRSRLKPDGAEYSVLESYKLRG